MKPSTDELTAFLEEASYAPVPPPGEPFLRRLEGRLLTKARGEQEVVAERPARGLQWAFPRLAPVLAAAAVVIAAVTVLPDRGAQRIDSTKVPPASDAPTTLAPVPTTEAPPPVETTVPAPEPEPETTLPPETTTTVKPTTTLKPKPPTTTTAKPATTTTVKPVTTTTVKPTTTVAERPATYETLALECRAGSLEARPAITCSWSRSTSDDFGQSRLYRKSPDGSQAKIFLTEAREQLTFTDLYVDAGGTYTYWVEVKNTAVQLIGKGGPVSVACC